MLPVLPIPWRRVFPSRLLSCSVQLSCWVFVSSSPWHRSILISSTSNSSDCISSLLCGSKLQTRLRLHTPPHRCTLRGCNHFPTPCTVIVSCTVIVYSIRSSVDSLNIQTTGWTGNLPNGSHKQRTITPYRQSLPTHSPNSESRLDGPLKTIHPLTQKYLSSKYPSISFNTLTWRISILHPVLAASFQPNCISCLPSLPLIDTWTFSIRPFTTNSGYRWRFHQGHIDSNILIASSVVYLVCQFQSTTQLIPPTLNGIESITFDQRHTRIPPHENKQRLSKVKA